MAREVPRRLRRYVDAAVAAGWQLEYSASGHPRLVPPAGWLTRSGEPAVPVVFASTPSTYRGDHNSVARLRRAGVRIPHRGRG